jgi:HPt (histidine-containing phosphotransfer) domain-containing protein
MPFKKGQSGNPAGTPKDKKFINALNRAIAQDDGKKLRKAADKLLDNAAAGEAWAVRELADRLDGKPAQTQTVQGDPDRPVRHKVEWTVVDPAPQRSAKA